MNVKFIIVRHGFSVVNMLGHVDDFPIDDKNFDFVVDPGLTHVGMYTSRKNGCALRQTIHAIDLVVASNLRRAIQTAHYMVPKSTVHVMPYLKETGPRSRGGQSHPWNRPLDKKRQQTLLKAECVDVNYSYIRPDQWDVESSIHDFLTWFSKNRKSLPVKGNMNVLVCSHGTLISNFLKAQGVKDHIADNNGACMGKVSLSDTGYKIIETFVPLKYPGMVSSATYPRSFKSYCGDARCLEVCQEVN